MANKEDAALPNCVKWRWNIACNWVHNVCCKLSQLSICMFLLVKVLFIHLSEACFDFIKCKFQSHKPCWNYRHETTNGKYELLCALCLHSSFAISVTTYCSKLVLKRSFPGTDVWDFALKSKISSGLILNTDHTNYLSSKLTSLVHISLCIKVLQFQNPRFDKTAMKNQCKKNL